jgi:hypothetical protein
MSQPIYIVYGRYSGEGQRGNSSVERQMDIEHYRQRADRLGLPFVEVAFFDDAKSGFKGDNLEAELGKIFADIRSGRTPPGSVIGTESHSRLGRLSANEALYQYLDILRLGIKLDIRGRTLRTWESIGGLSGVLVLMEDFIDMVIAHKHSADLQRTLRDTYRIKRNQVRSGNAVSTMKKGGPGQFIGRACPAWLTPLDAPIVIEGREYFYAIIEGIANAVRMIFDWADSGVGLVVIARRLNERNISPLGNHHRKNPDENKGWSAGAVHNLLRNIAVIGLWQPHTTTREILDDAGNVRKIRYDARVADGTPLRYYPPIITENQFERVGMKLAAKRIAGAVARGGRKGRGFGNIITKLCHCVECGGRVNKKTDTRRDYLLCENARRGVRKPDGSRVCTNTHGFTYQALERTLFALAETRNLIAVLTASHDQDNEPNRARLETLARLIQRKRENYYEYQIELDDLRGEERRAQRERMRELMHEIDGLQMEHDTLDAMIQQADRRSARDYAERIEAGVARLNSPDEIERENARFAFHALLSERASFGLTGKREMFVEFRNDRTRGIIGFNQEGVATRYGLFDLASDVPIPIDLTAHLTLVGMRIERIRDRLAKCQQKLAEIAADPNVTAALATLNQ